MHRPYSGIHQHALVFFVGLPSYLTSPSPSRRLDPEAARAQLGIGRRFRPPPPGAATVAAASVELASAAPRLRLEVDAAVEGAAGFLREAVVVLAAVDLDLDDDA